MTEAEILATIAAFAAAAKRSVQAGYRFIELHAAHGYLVPPVPLAAVEPPQRCLGRRFRRPRPLRRWR